MVSKKGRIRPEMSSCNDLKVPLHVDYLGEQPLVLLPQLFVLEAEVTRWPLEVVRVRGGRCGQVQLGPSDAAPDEAEAPAADRPSGHGSGGVDCADAGGGGAIACTEKICWKDCLEHHNLFACSKKQEQAW